MASYHFAKACKDQLNGFLEARILKQMLKSNSKCSKSGGKLLTIDSILWLISVKFLEPSLPNSSYILSLVNGNVL